MSGEVVVVILNYRSAPLCIECLASLASERHAVSGLRCIVVDGASGDGSVTEIRHALHAYSWTSWVRLLELETNGGFAFGNNAAIRALLESADSFEYLMLLNPDTIVRAGAVARLAEFLRERPRVGIVGSQLENADGSFEQSGRRSPGVISEGCRGASLGILDQALRNWVVNLPIRETAFQCDWVSGAAMMIRRKVIEDVELLDDGFFLYFEELDFCDRARKAGWEVWLEPASVVMHLEGASTGVGQQTTRRSRHWYDSRSRYFRKHLGLLRWLLADFAWLAGHLSLSFRRMVGLGGGSSRRTDHEFRDLVVGDLCRLFVGKRSTSREQG